MKNLNNEEKLYFEKHLRQDMSKESEEAKELEQNPVNQAENPGYYHFTQDYNYPLSKKDNK